MRNRIFLLIHNNKYDFAIAKSLMHLCYQYISIHSKFVAIQSLDISRPYAIGSTNNSKREMLLLQTLQLLSRIKQFSGLFNIYCLVLYITNSLFYSYLCRHRFCHHVGWPIWRLSTFLGNGYCQKSGVELTDSFYFIFYLLSSFTEEHNCC